jgi:hypothetical protein
MLGQSSQFISKWGLFKAKREHVGCSSDAVGRV